MKARKVLVIGNYEADNQRSMQLFARVLVKMYSGNATVSLSVPSVYLTRFLGLTPLLYKYLGYIDKFIFFPIRLLFISRRYDLVHIADHSNAIYVLCVPYRRCVITCHDLLAVRGAFGDDSVACNASPFGIWLQRLIMIGLRRARAIVFDSHATFSDFLQLGGSPVNQHHIVIPIPLNSPFTSIVDTYRLSATELAKIPSTPYILMVGSSLPRKNRSLALRLIEFLGHTSHYSFVFAGDKLTFEEQNFKDVHVLGSRLFSIVRPSHALLNTLYCNAHALLFPSLSEGFGWPLVEAQTCHCPVIASNTSSIPEVAGNGALYSAPNDVATFAKHVQSLEDSSIRANLISLGSSNTYRYDIKAVTQAYIEFTSKI